MFLLVVLHQKVYSVIIISQYLYKIYYCFEFISLQIEIYLNIKKIYFSSSIIMFAHYNLNTFYYNINCLHLKPQSMLLIFLYRIFKIFKFYLLPTYTKIIPLIFFWSSLPSTYAGLMMQRCMK